jgi:hypothetical protein
MEMNIKIAPADTKAHPITAMVAPGKIPQGLKPRLI